jgi:hypothetical protein
VWRNEKIKRRALSAPGVLSSAIVIADFQGYVHFLDKNTGALVARAKVAKQRVSSAPATFENTVVVLTDGGTMAAFRVTPSAATHAPAVPESAPSQSAPVPTVTPAATPEPPAATPEPTTTPEPPAAPAPTPPPAPAPAPTPTQ